MGPKSNKTTKKGSNYDSKDKPQRVGKVTKVRRTDKNGNPLKKQEIAPDELFEGEKPTEKEALRVMKNIATLFPGLVKKDASRL